MILFSIDIYGYMNMRVTWTEEARQGIIVIIKRIRTFILEEAAVNL